MMKKVLSLILVVSMVVCLSVTAFAAENAQNVAENNGTASITVSGTYATGEDAAPLLNVDISWGAMSFTYTAGDTVWNPGDHSTTTDAGSWSVAEDTNFITVTNHSNAAVTATFGFEPAEDVDVTGEFEKDELTLATALNTTVEDAPSATTYFNITDGSIDADTDLGTITVTIAADSAAMKYQVGESVTIDGADYIVVEANAETAKLFSKSRGKGLLSTVNTIALPTRENYITAYNAGQNFGSVGYLVGDTEGNLIYVTAGAIAEGIQFNGANPTTVNIAVNSTTYYDYYVCQTISNVAE